MLKDVHPCKDDPAKRLTDLLPLQRPGPPGKLYADGVLDTVSSTGSCGRLAVDDSADATQINHFKQLQNQLDMGKLVRKTLCLWHMKYLLKLLIFQFITTLGGSVLVAFDSQNRVAGEKLGVGSALLGLAETVIVSQVSIENGSAYADYAMNAEDFKLS